MIQIGLAWLLMFGVADPPTAPASGAIIDEIRDVLGHKGKTAPWFAEYAMGLPAQPRPSGGTGTRRYFAESADRWYFEETAATFSLKILLGPKTLTFAYNDDIGHALCTGPANLAGAKPERWLGIHGFPVLPSAELDADIVSHLQTLLVGSKTLRRVQAADLRTYELAGRDGPLTIVIGQTRVQVSRPGERGAPSQILFRYASGEGNPPWIGAVTDLSARVNDPKSKVHRMAAGSTMMGALKAAVPEFDNETVVLDAAAQGRLARRHRYLLPDLAVAKVIEAKTMSGQLHYKVECGGSIYGISQYPKASRIKDDEAIARFVQARRKFGDYAVLNVVDPGTGANWLYYIKDDATLIVSNSDPDFRILKFEDPILDRLLGSFNAPKP